MNIIQKIPAILLALGFAAWFQELFSIEWSFPYCSSQADGPASAVWGMPLPYIRWGTVSSMEYFWMPTVLILNIALLTAVAYPFFSWALSKLSSVRKRDVGSSFDGAVFAPSQLVDCPVRETPPPRFRMERNEGALRIAAAVIGLFLIFSFGAALMLQIQIGVYRVPVSNIANESYESYTDFRPVRFGFKSLRYECTPLTAESSKQ